MTNTIEPKCRVCLGSGTLSVFKTVDSISILDAIENISNLKDLRSDNFTKLVCQPCADNVMNAYKTKVQCLHSDSTLRSANDSKVLDYRSIQVTGESLLATKEELADYEEIVCSFCGQTFQSHHSKDFQCTVCQNKMQLEPGQKPDDEAVEVIINSSIMNDNQETDIVIERYSGDEILNEQENNDGEDIIVDSRFFANVEDQTPPIAKPKSRHLTKLHFCCKCKNTYYREDKLVAHYTEAHPGKERYQNPDDDPSKFAGKTQCQLCFGYVKDMDRHRRYHHRSQPPALKNGGHQCMTCGKIYRQPQTVQRCEQKHLVVPKERIKCPKCPVTLSDQANLIGHMRLHSNVFRFNCNLCDKKFRKSSNLKSHLQLTHLNERNFKCEVCGKTMKQKSSLVAHMRIHTGERPYKCSFCSNTYMHPTDCKRHEMIHTGIRPYKCEICLMGFVKKSSLTIHVKTHKK